MATPRSPRSDGLLLVLGTTTSVAAARGLGIPAAADAVTALRSGGPAAVPFPVALSGLCGAAVLACTAWLLLGLLLALLAAAAVRLSPSGPLARLLSSVAARCTPALVRRVAATAVGVALAAGVAAPALADTGPRTPAPARAPAAGTTGPATGLVGLALPDRATGPAPVAASALALRARPVHVVRPGESLWSISAALLPADVGDAAVDRAWHRLHAANRERVGPDPDLVHPGTRLVVPDLTDRKDHP